MEHLIRRPTELVVLAARVTTPQSLSYRSTMLRAIPDLQIFRAGCGVWICRPLRVITNKMTYWVPVRKKFLPASNVGPEPRSKNLGGFLAAQHMNHDLSPRIKYSLFLEGVPEGLSRQRAEGSWRHLTPVTRCTPLQSIVETIEPRHGDHIHETQRIGALVVVLC